jgi:ketosteroid isomerase-like protein
MSQTNRDTMKFVDTLIAAVNNRDLEGLVECFDADYVNVNPAHPQRGFQGREQVRRNWSEIFRSVPDIQAQVVHSAVDGDNVWTEWEMSGTRTDGAVFNMCGVFIFGVADGRARWARMFLEPVEVASGDADAAIRRLTGAAPKAPVR